MERFQIFSGAIFAACILASFGTASAGHAEHRYVRTSLGSLLQQQTKKQIAGAATVRYHPAAFPRSIRVLNMTVSCDEPSAADRAELFAQPTWRCNNIRVDNHRLPFCESSPRALNEQAMGAHLGLPNRRPGLDYCGQLADRKANLPMLCGFMLLRLLRASAAGSMGFKKQQLQLSDSKVPFAYSVKIPHGNCSYPEKRRVSLSGRSPEDAAWLVEKHSNPGFVTDLACSFDPEGLFIEEFSAADSDEV